MMQETLGVELRSLLKEAFVRLGDEPAPPCSQAESTGDTILVQRSAEDRSRTRQMVLEELARRAQVQQGVGTHSVESKIAHAATAAVGQEDLFPVDLPASGELLSAMQTLPAFSAPRISVRAKCDVRSLVATVYRSLMRRLPEDHVVLNPIANAEFIVRCRELGATVPEAVLNRTLLNNRKAKRHADILREPVSRLAPEIFEHIRHAVEIAASLVQREWFAVSSVVPSVDDMLCNPDQRRALSAYVNHLHDNVDPIDCHLALLAFRKSGREASARSADLSLPERSLFAPLKSLDPDDVPDGGGVYRVLCERRPVFVSSTGTLRARLREHLQRGGANFLPESLPFKIEGSLSVEVFHLPRGSARCDFDSLTRRLRLMAADDQVPTPPDLNWRESGALFASQDCVIKRDAVAG